MSNWLVRFREHSPDRRVSTPASLGARLEVGRGDRERVRDCDANAAHVEWSVGPVEATRVAGTGVRGVGVGDVALERVAGPTSVLKSTATASSAAASAVMRSARQRTSSERHIWLGQRTVQRKD